MQPTCTSPAITYALLTTSVPLPGPFAATPEQYQLTNSNIFVAVPIVYCLICFQ